MPTPPPTSGIRTDTNASTGEGDWNIISQFPREKRDRSVRSGCNVSTVHINYMYVYCMVKDKVL